MRTRKRIRIRGIRFVKRRRTSGKTRRVERRKRGKQVDKRFIKRTPSVKGLAQSHVDL
jgi:hypothetical protein